MSKSDKPLQTPFAVSHKFQQYLLGKYLKILEGKLNKFGVLAPEACGIDPDNFFQELGSFLGHADSLKTIVSRESV